MSLIEVEGDLFDGYPAIGHGCNCVGVMGAGVAGIMAQKYPRMRDEYVEQCKQESFVLGDVMSWHRRDGHHLVSTVYNLGTQYLPGAHGNLGAIAVGVNTMLENASWDKWDNVAIPRIGAGIAGLAWLDVRNVLEGIADMHSVNLTVVSLPGA